jgi:hypothetical protein
MSAPDLGTAPILRIAPPEISGNGLPPMVAHVASSGATFSLSHAGHIVMFHDPMRGSARKLRLSPVFQDANLAFDKAGLTALRRYGR